MENKNYKLSINEAKAHLKELERRMHDYIESYQNKHNRSISVKNEILDRASTFLDIDDVKFIDIQREDDGSIVLLFELLQDGEALTSYNNGDVIFEPRVTLKEDGDLGFKIKAAPITHTSENRSYHYSNETLGFKASGTSNKRRGFMSKLDDKPALKQLLFMLSLGLNGILLILFICTFITSSKANTEVHNMQKALFEKGLEYQDGKFLKVNNQNTEGQ